MTIEKYGNRFVDEYYNFVNNMTEILMQEQNEQKNAGASVLAYQKRSHIEKQRVAAPEAPAQNQVDASPSLKRSLTEQVKGTQDKVEVKKKKKTNKKGLSFL